MATEETEMEIAQSTGSYGTKPYDLSKWPCWCDRWCSQISPLREIMDINQYNTFGFGVVRDVHNCHLYGKKQSLTNLSIYRSLLLVYYISDYWCYCWCCRWWSQSNISNYNVRTISVRSCYLCDLFFLYGLVFSLNTKIFSKTNPQNV